MNLMRKLEFLFFFGFNRAEWNSFGVRSSGEWTNVCVYTKLAYRIFLPSSCAHGFREKEDFFDVQTNGGDESFSTLKISENGGNSECSEIEFRSF